jgi:hypothetical protein
MKPRSPSWSRNAPRNRVLDNRTLLPQNAIPAMTREKPLVHGTAVSPAGQASEFA